MKRSIRFFCLSLLVLAMAAFATGARPVPVTVFTRGEIAGLAERFSSARKPFTFARLPGGEFKKPAVVQYAMLNPPASIRHERTEHEVEVGAIISDKGKIVATCIVSSNCKAMEGAARSCAAEYRFNPASLDGQPVCFYVVLPISYKYVDPAEQFK